MTDDRLTQFRARFGIRADPQAFQRFQKRVTQAAGDAVSGLMDADRLRIEDEFAFRNGSNVIQGKNWGSGMDLRHGLLDELARANDFAQLVERIQLLLWTFEHLGYFVEKHRYGADYAGLIFTSQLKRAIALSPGIDLRLQALEGTFELSPAGVDVLDKVVDDVAEWLKKYPDVRKEFRQALTILAEKKEPQYRQALDSLRYALEKLLKLLCANNIRLEEQGRPLKIWLESKGVSPTLRDVVAQTMIVLTKQFQNAAVKHDNEVAGGVEKSWAAFEIEYVIYQYASLLRLLSEAADGGVAEV